MAAVPDDLETQPHVRAVPAEAAPAEHAAQPDDPEVTCSEDGSRCLSREERRATGRRVIAERQRAFELLEKFDSR